MENHKNLKEWEGKKVYIRTTLKRIYTGVIMFVDLGEVSSLITFKDKYGKMVSLLSNQIEELREE